jgi:hypothetical protein
VSEAKGEVYYPFLEPILLFRDSYPEPIEFITPVIQVVVKIQDCV